MSAMSCWHRRGWAWSGLGIVGAGMLRLVDGWPLQAKQGHITVIL